MPCPLSPSDRRARHGPTRPSAATIALAFLLRDPVPLAVQVNGQLEETIEPREHASTQHHLGGSAAFPSGAAQTRIVSAARIRLDPRKSVRSFKGIICGDISEFESSLSGRVGVKRFQTAPSILVLMSLAGILASLRDRHSGPPMMGSEGCGGPISRYVLAVRLTAGIKTRNGLASSIVPAGTWLNRVGGIQFSPIAIVHN